METQAEDREVDAAWQVHVEGIRHRRNALSIRETGARGALVVSMFEGDGSQGPALFPSLFRVCLQSTLIIRHGLMGLTESNMEMV